MSWNIFTEDLGMRGLNRIHWCVWYWKSWAASPSHQWQYGFSSESCPPTAREISNMGSQWLLIWTTTGKTRLRSLFLIKLILALSWTRGNTRVEKVDYLASFSCFLTNVSSQINWWDSPTHLPLSVFHGTIGYPTPEDKMLHHQRLLCGGGRVYSFA